VQNPFDGQSYNRYAYALNNPLIYTDPSGEKWWHWLLGAALIGIPMMIDPASTAIGIPTVITATITMHQAVAHTYTGLALGVDAGVTYLGTLIKGDTSWGKKRFKNRMKMIGGLFQGNFGEILSHWTWENIQTNVGLGWSLNRNTFGKVDRVDYFDGATFVTNENSTNGPAVSLGNYINADIQGEITGDFDNYVLSNPMYMHEYGHMIDSRTFGWSYLFAVGIPSLISADNSKRISGNNPNNLSTHDVYWTELRANRRAARYFRRHYGVNWSGILFDGYPLANPF
jgi:hypothetical protein